MTRTSLAVELKKKKIALSTNNLNIKQLKIYLYSLVFAYFKMQLNILECEGADFILV